MGPEICKRLFGKYIEFILSQEQIQLDKLKLNNVIGIIRMEWLIEVE